jgi:acetate---CoA ligase (ADP-forming)
MTSGKGAGKTRGKGAAGSAAGREQLAQTPVVPPPTGTGTPARGSLQPLLDPRSIAVLGASGDPEKLNGRTVRALIDKKFDGGIYPVNPKYDRIADLVCYPDVAALPDGIDLAIVATPAAVVAQTLRELAAKGVRAAVVFSSGFSETGAEGALREEEVRAAVRDTGIRMLGPNCLGFINAARNVMATFSQFAMGPTPPGPAAFVTQSGALGTATNSTARRRHFSFGYFINTGNEVDVEWAEAMRAVLDDPAIRVGSGYIEGLRNGERFVDTARHAIDIGKPIVAIKVGRTVAGARAAASHTGALAGADAVFDGVARQYGLLRVRNEEQLLDMVEVLSCCPEVAGNGLAVITRSGGAGVIMADRAGELGLEIAQFTPQTRARLKEVVPVFGAIGNPVDVTAQGLVDPTLIQKSIEIVLDDPNVHAAIMWLSLTEKLWQMNVDIFKAIKAKYDKPLIVCWVSIPEPALLALREAGIAVIRSAEPSVDALAGLVHFSAARRRWLADAPARASITLPALPTLERLAGSARALTTLEGAALLAEAGIACAPVRLAANADEAVACAIELGYPVALKIESPDILHKTEVHGIKLGLADEAAVRAAWAVIQSNLRRHQPQARVAGMIVQKMIEGDAEFVLGVSHDAVFGPVVMAGIGGVLVEVVKDVTFRRAPITPDQAASMLDDLRGRAILDGVRGKPPVARDRLIELMCAVSRLAAAAGPRLVELDLNPIMLSAEHAIAVDWLIVAR